MLGRHTGPHFRKAFHAAQWAHSAVTGEPVSSLSHTQMALQEKMQVHGTLATPGPFPASCRIAPAQLAPFSDFPEMFHFGKME